MCPGKIRGYGGEFLSGLRDSRAGAEAAKQYQIACLPAVALFGTGRKRFKNVRAADQCEVKILGKDADDRALVPIEAERCSEGGLVTVEPRFPKPMADDSDAVVTELALARQEPAAESRLHAERVEEI